MKELRASGSNSQRLPSTTRGANGISGARKANDSAVAPAMRAGIGRSSSRVRAAARMPMAVCGGGIEEWPPREWRETTRAAGHRQALYVTLGMVAVAYALSPGTATTRSA